jgi:ABC-type transporter Mla subunit MlaD
VATHDSQLGTAIDNLTTVIGSLAQKGTDLGNLIDNTQSAASQIDTLVTNNRPQLQSVVAQLQSVLGVLSAHQLDLAQGVSSAAAAVTGFSSIGSSGSTPVSWGNIFFNVLGSTPLEGILGSCGTLDTVLNAALGPDPLPCSQQNGPLVGTTPAPATPAPATAGANASSTTSTTAPSTSATSTTTTNPSLGNGIAGILGLGSGS